MNEYLSATELHSLTDYAQSAKQAAWLKDHGLRVPMRNGVTMRVCGLF